MQARPCRDRTRACGRNAWILNPESPVARRISSRLPWHRPCFECMSPPGASAAASCRGRAVAAFEGAPLGARGGRVL